MAKSNVFGHKVYYDFEVSIWRYADNKKPCQPLDSSRKCPKCKEFPTEDGHDPCIANLPGVEFACCGHGKEFGYVAFSNGKVMRGIFDEEDE